MTRRSLKSEIAEIPHAATPDKFGTALLDRLMQLQLAIDEIQAALDEIAALIAPPEPKRALKPRRGR